MNEPIYPAAPKKSNRSGLRTAAIVAGGGGLAYGGVRVGRAADKIASAGEKIGKAAEHVEAVAGGVRKAGSARGVGLLRRIFKFSAFVEDMRFGDLPKDIRDDVLRFVTAKKDHRFPHYGMVVKELIPKADPHNLKTARAHVKDSGEEISRKLVQMATRKGTKFIFLLNDRIIDGHHFLAMAEHAGVTSSLNVLDLTPARFQLSARRRILSFAKPDDQSPNRLHDILTGGIEGGVGVLATDRLIHRFVPPGSGLGRKIAIGAGVGAAATGLIGAGLSAAAARKAKGKANGRVLPAQTPQQQFAIMPGKPSVAKDRYTKAIHEHEQERKESNYLRSGAGGAAVGALVHRRIGKAGTTRGRGALLGAGAGLVAQAAVRAASSNKDQFGEESYAGKRLQKVPWEAAGATAIGIGGKRLLDRARGIKKVLPKILSARPRRVLSFAAAEDRREAVAHGAALAGGISAADGLTAAVFPEHGAPRKRAIKSALLKGAVYGTGLALAEPAILAALRRTAPKKKEQPKKFSKKRPVVLQFRRGDLMNRLLGGAKLAAPGLIARAPGPVAKSAASLTHIHDVIANGQHLTLPRGGRAQSQLSPYLRTGYRQLKPHVVSMSRVGRPFLAAGAAARNGRPTIAFRGREQYFTDTDTAKGVFADPLKVASGEQHGYTRDEHGGRNDAVPTFRHAQVLRAAYNKGQDLQRTATRGARLGRDVKDAVTGTRRTDERGRPLKREWEKGYFQNTAKAALTAGGLLLHHRAMRNNPNYRRKVASVVGGVKRKANEFIPDLFPSMSARQPLVTGVVDGRVIHFDVTAPDWDIRDQRGRSARVFAPGARARTRREKYWHEKTDNIKRIATVGAVLAATGGGVLGYKLGKRRLPVAPKVAAAAGDNVIRGVAFSSGGAKALGRKIVRGQSGLASRLSRRWADGDVRAIGGGRLRAAGLDEHLRIHEAGRRAQLGWMGRRGVDAEPLSIIKRSNSAA